MKYIHSSFELYYYFLSVTFNSLFLEIPENDSLAFLERGNCILRNSK